MTWLFNRTPHVSNSATPLALEFFERKSLMQLGFHSDLSGISEFKARCFLILNDRYCELDTKRRNKK